MMSEIKFPERKGLRYKNYDYSSSGFYFITICTNNKKQYFGKLYPVKDSDTGIIKYVYLKRNKIADIVEMHWKSLQSIYPYINNQIFTIMPDHIHGIIAINTDGNYSDCEIKTISEIIQAFKSVTTREFKRTYGINESLWQKNYYDTIITNDRQYEEIVNYIINNQLNKILEEIKN